MSHVLILIAPAQTDRLGPLARTLAASLPGAAQPTWLAPNEAVEIRLPAACATTDTIRDSIAQAVEHQAIDWAWLPADGRRKRLLVADMDATIIEQECLDELADVAGIKPQIAAITERAMRGELDFAEALRERIKRLDGFPEEALSGIVETRLSLTPGARTLVATMKAHGAFTLLVSGGFTYFTSRVAAMAGFDAHQGNELRFVDGLLRGVGEPILGREDKSKALSTTANRLGIDPADALAVGDGANDLAMLETAGLGVAFHAKPVVAAQANARIDHCDLTALLYLQGYRRDEFTMLPH
jgi:phosphoserine phosphatase